MKKIFSTCISLLIFFLTYCQTNYSGTYSFAIKRGVNTGKELENEGPAGSLTLLKMENNKYRFWLNVNRGWPSYNMGESDGTIVIVNDTASFDNTYEGAANNCILYFKIEKNSIEIQESSSANDCGFANGVSAEGKYVKDKVQPVIDNKWLKEQYHQSPMVIVITNKAEVFKDENCLYTASQYFVKADTLLSIAETEKTVYTEFITPSGKFIYGWLKKSATKMAE